MNKLRKNGLEFVFFALFVLLLVIVFPSCDNNASNTDYKKLEEAGKGHAILDIVIEKNLDSSVQKNIRYWEFMATPLFRLLPGEGVEAGRVDYWRQLEAITTKDDGELKLETSLGSYMAGEWFFELRALNKRGHVVAIGSTRVYIVKGHDNIVSIQVFYDSSDGVHGESADDTSRVTGVTSKDFGLSTTKRYGTVKTGLVVNQLEDNLANMRISTSYQKIDRLTNVLFDMQSVDCSWLVKQENQYFPAWFKADEKNTSIATGVLLSGDSKEKIPQGKIFYESEFSLDAGRYILTYTIEVKNNQNEWQKIAGQSLPVYVLGGEYSEVKGTAIPSSYSIAGIKITVPGTIYGSINGEKYTVIANADSATLKWEQSDLDRENSSETPVSFDWYVDGVLQQEKGSRITITCPVDKSGNKEYGVYRISLSPKGSAGSWGFTDLDLIFRP